MMIQFDKRFEDFNKRFAIMMWFIGIGFTLVTVFITGAMSIMRHQVRSQKTFIV